MSSQASKVYTTAPAINRYKPERPAAVVLENEKFLTCPHEDPEELVCMTHEGARVVVRNKTKVIRWMKDADAVLDYYEADPAPQSVNK